jgi:hypothetical protein
MSTVCGSGLLVIEQVEHFGAKFKGMAVAEMEGFGSGKIHVYQTGRRSASVLGDVPNLPG